MNGNNLEIFKLCMEDYAKSLEVTQKEINIEKELITGKSTAFTIFVQDYRSKILPVFTDCYKTIQLVNRDKQKLEMEIHNSQNLIELYHIC